MNKIGWVGALLIGLFCFSAATAQEVIYSPYEKFDLRSGDFSVIGKIDGKIYTYRSSSDGAFIDIYNDAMEKAATVVLDFFPKKIYAARFINYSDKMVVLYQAVETGKVIQYAALLDEKGRLLKGPIQLTSAKTGIFGPSKNYFSSAVSDDKKQILIYAVEDNGDELHFTGIWLDDKLDNLQRGAATFTAQNNIAEGDGILDNEGNFYLPAFTPTGSHNYADQVWLLTLAKGGRRFYSKELPLNDKYSTSLYMKLDEVNHRMYTGGFYSDKKNGNYEGVIYAYYDLNDSTWANRKNLAFDDQIRNATGERNKKRAFNNYEVKQMILKKDGGFVLIAEDFSITTRTTTPGWGGYYYSYYYSPFNSQSIREYNYNDLFVVSYDGNGVRDWSTFIRKNQYSQEDGGIFSSYGLINAGGSLGFLFNDFNTRVSKIQLATVSGDGKLDMRSLAEGTANDPDWLPRSAKQVGLKELVVPCLQRRQLCFAKIVF
jgi:hypothetical protein